jgi:S1-C subfamily serine protease
VSLPARVIRFFNLTQETGVYVVQVVKGSPADNAGLKEGDVIISIAGHTVSTVDDIHKRLTAETIGKKLGITYLRGWAQTFETYATPDRSPD